VQLTSPGGRAAAFLLLIAFAGAKGGCAVSVPEVEPRAGLGCIDDSVECINRRKATLRHLVDDPGRTWIKEPATPEAYASGVRLFAFKAKKRDLSCAELQHGRKEADAARAALTSAGKSLTPMQVARGAMLAQEVGRELKTEYNRRCNRS
jgi:hypothetical protein